MIYVFNIICMLHYQELTRKSISKSTVKYNKALGLCASSSILRSEIKASYDNDTKKGIRSSINMHEINVGFLSVYIN